MKRRTNNTNGRHDGWGDRPVETTRHTTVSKSTDVQIPRGQSFWVALPLSVSVIVSFVAPALIGQRIFYASAGVAALAAFLWSLVYEVDWQDRMSMPFLVGVVAWCFWRFSEFAGFSVPEQWQPYPALFATGALVFWWTFTGALWLTMLQRLGMPIEHQQYSVWKALGELIEHFGKKERPVAQEAQAQTLFEFHFQNGHVRHNVRPPLPDDMLRAAFRVLQGSSFSEANLCGPGKPLPGGVNGRQMLSDLRDWLIQWELAEWRVIGDDGEPVTRQGIAFTENGQRFFVEYGGSDE